jgi:hypothetical protein
VLYLLLALAFKIALGVLGRWLLPAAAGRARVTSGAKTTAGETQTP